MKSKLYPKSHEARGWRLCPLLAWIVLALTWLVSSQNLAAAPTITLQPEGVSVSIGGTTSLRVFATSSGGSLSFQWYLIEAAVPGATNYTLSLTNIQVSQGGDYHVIVTDNGGSIRSATATVQVDPTFIQADRDRLGDDGFLQTGTDGPFPFWVDYDGDGWLEIMVRRGTYVAPPRLNEVYENNRDGTFTRVTNGLARLEGRWGAGTWADFDRDGDLDCVMSQWQPILPWMFLSQQSQGTADFTPIDLRSLTRGGTPVPGGYVSFADYDADGWVDLAITYWLGSYSNVLLHNVGGQFEVVTNTPFAVSGEGIEWHSWVDYDDDGDIDFFGPTSNGPAKGLLFQNQGDGSFLRITNHVLANQPSYNLMAGWGDYDNDGDLDVYLPYYGFPSVLYRNVGVGQFEVDDQAPPLDPAVAPTCPTWADYDNDGDLDLIVAHDRSPLRLFSNDGTGKLTEVLVGSPTGATASTNYLGWWADYNNDGFLDLLAWRDPQPSFLFLNNLPQAGNPNHWLKMQLHGTLSNPNGLGAKVRVRATIAGRTVWQMRQIGILPMMPTELLAHFGLGDATNVDVLRVEWPSGVLQELTDVTANQFLTVEEQGVGVLPRTVITAPGSNITLRAIVAGVSSPQYQWKLNGTNLPGATSDTLVLNNIQVAEAGSYTVEASDDTQIYRSMPSLAWISTEQN